MDEFFLNCDWGTSRFRLRLVEVSGGTIRAERVADEGVAALPAASGSDRGPLFEEVLRRHVAALAADHAFPDDAPVLISGMASSSLGWRNPPYAALPFPLDGSRLSCERLATESSRPVFLFSGVRGPSEVMRGEETELIGLAALLPELRTLPEVWVVLPGTHSKHVCVRHGVMTEFHTCMTGELFHLLGTASSLRHPRRNERTSPAPSPDEHARWHEHFTAGVDRSRRPDLTSALFQVRTGQLLQGHDHVQSSALLSGLLIGHEVQSLQTRLTATAPVVLAASPELHEAYRLALAQTGLAPRLIETPPDAVNRLTALGQLAALRHLARIENR